MLISRAFPHISDQPKDHHFDDVIKVTGNRLQILLLLENALRMHSLPMLLTDSRELLIDLI